MKWVSLFDQDRSAGVNVQERVIEDLVWGLKGVVIKSDCLDSLLEAMKSYINDQAWIYKAVLNIEQADLEHLHPDLLKVNCEICDEDSIVSGDIILLPDGSQE